MDTNPDNSQDTGSKKLAFEELSKEELVQRCKGLLTLAQKAKQAKNELQNEVESYKLQLDKCQKEKDKNCDNAKTLQELVDSLTEQKLNYITEIDTSRKQVKTLKENLTISEEELCRIKKELGLKDKAIGDISQKLSDLDSEIISLKRQNNRLANENDQLINQLTELETQAAEFKNIGLQQREQLEILEEKVKLDDTYKEKVQELNIKIKELEHKLESSRVEVVNEQKCQEWEIKLKEISHELETEKLRNEKANVKLRSYKDKILKCASCINQLKNSRYILTKTVKEYSENIPKWRNEIINASKVLEEQINELNNENIALKNKFTAFENHQKNSSENKCEFEEVSNKVNQLNDVNVSLKQELSDVMQCNVTLTNNLNDLQNLYKELKEITLPAQLNDNKVLKEQLNEMIRKAETLSLENTKLQKHRDMLEHKSQNSDNIESLNLQVKALESEKDILVKEKLNAKDNISELENQNKILSEQIKQMTSEIQSTNLNIKSLAQQKEELEKNYNQQKDEIVYNLECKIRTVQELYDLLKKEYDNLQDVNGLLKEEVETLKLSLEQPKDDTENLSDLNVSLQADIVKLETKLSAYKQENASLLAESKEMRAKCKEFDSLAAEYEEAKSKLIGYKTENTELLNEMKEINQVLKERGEAISKLQKAVAEMERLIETLEQDRDSGNNEREDLNKKIESLENDLKNATQDTQNRENMEQVTKERDDAVKLVAEKDNLITSLKDDIEKLKSLQNTSDLPNEDMSTSTISKAEEHSRMKDLDETFEEKYTKLRLFALKLKKKLNETTAQLHNAEQDKARLEKALHENGSGEGKAQIPINVEMPLESPTREEDKAKIVELETKVKSLTVFAEASEKVADELEKVKAELVTKTQELTVEIEAHKATKESLEKARRDVKKKNVLSLEMEDYERSMKELTAKMEDSKRKMVQMESTIDNQEGTITAMRTQIKLLEEQIRTDETQNRLIKEELQAAIENGKEKDSVIQTKNDIILKLEQDLEDEKRKTEEGDLEMTSILSEKEKAIITLGEEKTDLLSKLKRQEFKSAELSEQLKMVIIELADLKTEHTSYKVRAQAVLRQNQNVDHSQEEQLKEETAALRAQIETLTAKLNTALDQTSEQSVEVEASRRRAAEAVAEATRAAQRTTRLQADLARLHAQLDNERAQHKLQVSTLTQCYKAQISELEVKLSKETEALKKQLVLAQTTVKTVAVTSADQANQNQYMVPVIPKDDSDGEMDFNVSMIPREEGEGSESAPSPPLSKSFLAVGASGRSPVPLERLLEEGVPEDETLDTTSLGLTPDQEINDLRRKLVSQQQRVKHVTLLLSESERECARMAQLSELLKSELRRVRGTTANAHNTEYMKNVTLKFLTLPPGDERSRLVPVLQKILTLTQDETNKIQAVAKGQDPNSNKGWGSYLPWPGGK